MVKESVMGAFCEGVTSECVREECITVAMATLKNARFQWQIQEKVRVLEEVTKVVSMEMAINIVTEQVSEVVQQLFR